jgi:hypothetical protein
MVRFLRTGYPSGAPATGYVPLLALLPRRVSDDEIDSITIELFTSEGRPIDSADVGVEISRITDEMPSLDDIERVKRRVDATGWTRNYHG